MNNKLLIGAIAISGLVAVSACSDTFDPSSDSAGRILLDVDLNREVAAPVKTASKARAAGRATEVSASDLRLTLKADDGSMERSWDSLSDFDGSEDFPVGMYTMEASYGSLTEEGFDKPYYFGSTSLRVKTNETTPVSITARLANAMVTIVYTEAAQNYFTACQGEVVSSSGVSHEYAVDETRALYVQPGHVDVNVAFTKPNGAGGTMNCSSFEAEARHHYIVTIDVNDGEVGDGVLVITFNSDLAEEEVTLDISDDILNAPAPTITASGFTPGEAVAIVEGSATAEPLRMTVMAQGVVSTAVLTTRSASLLGQGWPATVDFAAADAATLAKLKELGLTFPGLEGVKSKMAVVDFTNVLSHIAYVDGDDNTVEFTLTAKDAYSKVSEPMTLSVNVDKLQFSVEEIQPLAVDETALSFIVKYNGGALQKDVAFQIKNARGTWDAVTVASVTPVDGSNDTYNVTLTVPGGADDVVFRAVAGGVTTEEYEVTRRGASIALSDNDVFATYATLTVGGSNASELASQARLMLSTDGSSFTEYTSKSVDGTEITFTGLTPATRYHVKVEVNDGESSAVQFTTEAAAQFPNSEMEDWYSEDAYGSKTLWVGKTDIKCWYPNAVGSNFWATRNPRTTGQTSGTTCYYTSFSGTVAVAGVSGNAAEISTLGVGEGDTYAHTKSGVENDSKYKIPGMLFVGDFTADGQSGETIQYGKEFTSRPKSMSFKYKFDPSYNNESFTAYLVIENRENGTTTELARGAVVSNEAKTEFTDCTVELTYSNKSLKATHAYAVFLSSTSDAPKVYSKQGSDGAFAGYADSKYVGSVLTVDDITLNY